MIQSILFVLLSLTPFSADKVDIIKENGMSVIHMIGNVVIDDDKTKIECEDAQLYETEDYVVLRENVVISDREGSIAAQRARYHFSDNIGYMSDSVRLVSDEQIIYSDSLFYDGEKQQVEMHRNVVIEDTGNNMFGYGDIGWYDLKEDIGHLTDAPHLEIQRDEKDPIRITAERFVLHSNKNLFYGYDSVIALIDSITIYCDTFTYHLDTDKGTMFEPRIVEKNNTLQGETGFFSIKDDDIDVFGVYSGSSEYHSEEGNVNMVEGDTITIYFEDGRAVEIVVEGNPEGVLHLSRSSDDTED